VEQRPDHSAERRSALEEGEGERERERERERGERERERSFFAYVFREVIKPLQWLTSTAAELIVISFLSELRRRPPGSEGGFNHLKTAGNDHAK